MPGAVKATWARFMRGAMSFTPWRNVKRLLPRAFSLSSLPLFFEAGPMTTVTSMSLRTWSASTTVSVRLLGSAPPIVTSTLKGEEWAGLSMASLALRKFSPTIT